MKTDTAQESFRGLSISAVLFGALGGVFFWWVPMGMVLSIAGMMLGFIDWLMARRRSLDFRLGMVGLFLSAAALALDIVIVALGLQTVTFGG